MHITGTTLVLVLLPVLSLVEAFSAVPLIVASHTLVKGAKEPLEHDNASPHTEASVTNMLKKMITECSSDAYLIINQPGLKYNDMVGVHTQRWPFLTKYLAMASTVVGVPWVKQPIDMNFLENYIVKNCEAETINVLSEDENEVAQYIDTRKRVIRVELSELPGEDEVDEDTRGLILKGHDELIRRILRKVPSPHYTIILTSSTPSSFHPLPRDIIREQPGKFEMFDEIINHPSRQQEVERNAHNFQQVAPEWNQDKNTINRYLRNRKQDEIHLFRGERSGELWQKHEKLVSTLVVMIASVFMMKVLRWAQWLQQKIGQWGQRKPYRRQADGLLNRKVD